MYLRVIRGNMIQAFQQKRRRVLGNRLRRISRCIRHDNAAPFRFFDIYNIKPRRRHADIAKRRTGFHDFPRDDDLIGQYDFRVADSLNRLLGRRPFVNRHVAKLIQRIVIQLIRAKGVRIQNNDFSLFSHLSQPSFLFCFHYTTAIPAFQPCAKIDFSPVPCYTVSIIFRSWIHIRKRRHPI